MKDITSINKVISDFFEAESEVNIIAVKKLMPRFIEAGVFLKDKKNGLPIRTVLKTLDEEKSLDKIPAVHVIRKNGHSYWYFKREGYTPEHLEIDNTPAKEFTKRELKKLEISEERYVLDLCDEAMRVSGLRHHKFDFLLGDSHRSGRARSPIPCDLYYPDSKVVIEFIGHSHIPLEKEQVAQRELYAKRKSETLTKHSIQVIEIQQDHFDLTDLKHIKRDKPADLLRVQKLLEGLKKHSEEEE